MPWLHMCRLHAIGALASQATPLVESLLSTSGQHLLLQLVVRPVL